ncbi:hypothetical protein Tco_0012947 [Tanacetum coccineum]
MNIKFKGGLLGLKDFKMILRVTTAQALKTWLETFGVLLKSPMINMNYGVFHIREINIRPSMEIEVRRVDNDLYMFKEGDFSRLRINDIEDMLILIVQNRLTNLSGDDVSDFAIAL